jgi:hypothetical protein
MKNIVPLSFRWFHKDEKSIMTIAAGMRRYWILGAMMHRNDSSKVYFQLFTESKWTQGSDELDPGEYILNVTVGAANAKPRSTKISITVPSGFEEPQINLDRVH